MYDYGATWCGEHAQTTDPEALKTCVRTGVPPAGVGAALASPLTGHRGAPRRGSTDGIAAFQEFFTDPGRATVILCHSWDGPALMLRRACRGGVHARRLRRCGNGSNASRAAIEWKSNRYLGSCPMSAEHHFDGGCLCAPSAIAPPAAIAGRDLPLRQLSQALGALRRCVRALCHRVLLVADEGAGLVRSRRLRTCFCPTCGSTVGMREEVLHDRVQCASAASTNRPGAHRRPRLDRLACSGLTPAIGLRASRQQHGVPSERRPSVGDV